MPTYTFKGAKPETTVVFASDEKEARHLAMVARWGDKPDPNVGTLVVLDRYSGYGLDLVKVSA